MNTTALVDVRANGRVPRLRSSDFLTLHCTLPLPSGYKKCAERFALSASICAPKKVITLGLGY